MSVGQVIFDQKNWQHNERCDDVMLTECLLAKWFLAKSCLVGETVLVECIWASGF
jgi:hypothetical protein